MSDTTRIFTVPEGNGGGNMAPLIASLCQNRGLDPNMVAAMMNNNRGNNGGWGDMGAWWIVILLIFGWGGFGNGFGGGFGGRGSAQGLADLGNLVNNDAGRELLMSAIQGNGTAISQLASTVHCDVNALQGAIANVSQSLCQLGNQMGQNTNQVLTAIMQGNNTIASQLCECCCSVKSLITEQGYQNQLATCNQTNTLVATANANTLALRDGATANTNAILAKLDAAEMRAMQDKLDALRERNTALVAQLSNEHQTAAIQAYQAQAIAPVNAALADLSSRLAKIECNQPEVAKIPFVPAAGNYIPVNYGINVNPLATQCGC